MTHLGIGSYDAVHLATARRLSAPLLTNDRLLAQATAPWPGGDHRARSGMRIGSLEIRRIADRHREGPRAPDYDHTVGNRAYDLGFDLPDGWTCTRSAAGPADGVPTTVMAPEEIAAIVRPGAFADPVAREQHVVRHAGSIRLGFAPRKADYRARWRYNSEEFDDAE